MNNFDTASTESFDEQLAAERRRLQRSGRYRTLESRPDPVGRVITVEGRPLLNFCSNDYLGLGADSRLKQAAIEATEQFGVGAGAAQLLAGRTALHEALEERLADFTGAPAALLFSSGYLANLGLIQAVVRRTDQVFHDRLNHASLIDAVTLSRARHHRYEHGDVDAVEGLLTDPAHSGHGRRWVVTESVFSMDGDIAPIADLAGSARRHAAGFIVDDAHGLGVLGHGRGVSAHFAMTADDFTARVVTFGKALGTAGAAVLGSRDLIDHLVQRARTFIYDTASPPALVAATRCAIEIIASDPEPLARLEGNIARFRSAAAAAGVSLSPDSTPIQPIIIGADDDAVAAARSLVAAGFYVRAIRPPTVPAGTARLRICISAAHTHDDVDALVAALRDLALAPAAA